MQYVPEHSEGLMWVLRDTSDGTLVQTENGRRTYEAPQANVEWVAGILNRHPVSTKTAHAVAMSMI